MIRTLLQTPHLYSICREWVRTKIFQVAVRTTFPEECRVIRESTSPLLLPSPRSRQIRRCIII